MSCNLKFSLGWQGLMQKTPPLECILSSSVHLASVASAMIIGFLSMMYLELIGVLDVYSVLIHRG